MDDDLYDPPVGSHVALLDRVPVPNSGEHLSEKDKVHFQIIRVHEVCKRSSVQSRARNTHKFGEGIVATHDAPLDVDNCNADRGMVEGEVEQCETHLSAVLYTIIFRLHVLGSSSADPATIFRVRSSQPQADLS